MSFAEDALVGALLLLVAQIAGAAVVSGSRVLGAVGASVLLVLALGVASW